jgi:hypothetical protein
MNTEHRGQDNLDNISENPFLTFLSRPLLPNPLLEELWHVRPSRHADSEERPMTSTGRRVRSSLEEDMTQHDETLASHELNDGNEISFPNLQGLNPQGMLGSIVFSFMEQLQSSLEDEMKQGLPKEMIEKVKRMKMGKSGQDCSVCSDGFRKGEKIRKLPCKHIFHDKCIMPWLDKNSTCPNCRFNLLEFFTENPDGDYH